MSLDNEVQGLPQAANGGGYADLSPSATSRHPSRLRTLAPMLKVPDMAWLAGGLPPTNVFPIKSFSVDMIDGSHLVIDTPELLFDAQQYTIDVRGHGPLRQFWTDHIMDSHALEQEPLVTVTTGSSDSLNKTFSLLLGPGDSLFLEELSFPASISMIAPLRADGINVVPVKIDESTGCMDPADLSEKLKTRAANSRAVVYVVPYGSNPLGATMPLKSREEIYQLCIENSATLLEDDAYFYLQYNQPGSTDVPGLYGLRMDPAKYAVQPPSFLRLDGGRHKNVIRLDTVSKFLCPGLRVGWFTTYNERWATVLKMMTQTTTQSACGLAQVTIGKLMSEAWIGPEGKPDGFHRHLIGLQSIYKRKLDVLTSSVEKALEEFRDADPNYSLKLDYTKPSAGMFMWVKPVAIDKKTSKPNDAIFQNAVEYIPFMEKNKVIAVPGSFFGSAENFISGCLRVNFATAEEDLVERGGHDLVKAMSEFLQSKSAANGV